LDGVPTFVQRRPLTCAALRFALRAHGDDWREADGAPFILHPLEVASPLHSLERVLHLSAVADPTGRGADVVADAPRTLAHAARVASAHIWVGGQAAL